jgi:hypothetical protein
VLFDVPDVSLSSFRTPSEVTQPDQPLFLVHPFHFSEKESIFDTIQQLSAFRILAEVKLLRIISNQ